VFEGTLVVSCLEGIVSLLLGLLRHCGEIFHTEIERKLKNENEERKKKENEVVV